MAPWNGITSTPPKLVVTLLVSCNATQQRQSPPTIQWHPAMALRPLHPATAHSPTIQWHPAMAPHPLPQCWSSPSPPTISHYNGTHKSSHQWHHFFLRPAMAPWCHIQSAKVVRRPPPLFSIAIAISRYTSIKPKNKICCCVIHVEKMPVFQIFFWGRVCYVKVRNPWEDLQAGPTQNLVKWLRLLKVFRTKSLHRSWCSNANFYWVFPHGKAHLSQVYQYMYLFLPYPPSFGGIGAFPLDGCSPRCQLALDPPFRGINHP